MRDLPINVVSTDIHGGAFAIAVLLVGVVVITLTAHQACAKSPTPRTLIGLQMLAGTLLALSPVSLSPDPTSYVLFSRLYGVFGINPYLPPVSLPPDSVLKTAALVWGPSTPEDCYGPLWTLVAAGVARIEAHAPFAAQWNTHRLLAVAASALVSLGLLRLLRACDSRDAVTRVARFAFHPLVLIESGLNGHNDMLMIACAVWAFALLREAPPAAGLLLGASIGIKFVSVIIAPFFALLLWRTHEGRRGALFAAVGAACAVLVLSFAPFWAGSKTLDGVLGMQAWVESSPAALIARWYGSLHPHAPANTPQLIDDVLLGIWAAFAMACVSDFREKGERSTGYACVVGFIGALPLVMSYYVLWLSPMLVEQNAWGRYARYALAAAISCYCIAFAKALSWEQVQDVYTLAIVLVPPAIVWVMRRGKAWAGFVSP